MRDEAELRRYREAMEWALHSMPRPTDPLGPALMAGHMELLRWMMGDDMPGIQRMIDGLVENVDAAKQAFRYRARSNS